MKKLLIIFMFIPLTVSAAQKGFYMDTSVAGGYNPAAARITASMFYRLPLSADTAPLWYGTKTDLGITGSVTPVDYSGSVFLIFEPLAIFSLKMSGAYHRYYTTFGYGYRKVEGPDSPYSEKALSHIDPETNTAYKFVAEPTFRYKYERLIVVNTFSYTHINVKNDDHFYYEPYSNTIHKKNDYDYADSASFLFIINDYLSVGVNDYYQKVPSTDYQSNRIASLFVFTQKKGENELVAVFFAGSYTENRYYRGKLFAAFYIGKTIMLE
jgi:hypothetical protein